MKNLHSISKTFLDGQCPQTSSSRGGTMSTYYNSRERYTHSDLMYLEHQLQGRLYRFMKKTSHVHCGDSEGWRMLLKDLIDTSEELNLQLWQMVLLGAQFLIYIHLKLTHDCTHRRLLLMMLTTPWLISLRKKPQMIYPRKKLCRY